MWGQNQKVNNTTAFLITFNLNDELTGSKLAHVNRKLLTADNRHVIVIICAMSIDFHQMSQASS